MESVKKLSIETCNNIVGVLTDIDDTITTDGRLPSKAYEMLERLSLANIMVVPITGRPAGWCDMIARFWPIAGVVGENGALAMRYDHDKRLMQRIFNFDGKLRAENRSRLNKLADEILQDVKGTALASDQQYREADLAIDFCEDVPPLPEEDISRIVNHFHQAGAVAKVSSIHVNGWFGDWDKLSMSKKFFKQEFNIDLENEREKFIYCGDSPNDAPMFGFFPHACGVANVTDFHGKMESYPRYVANSRGAAGFVEIGEHILSSRNTTI